MALHEEKKRPVEHIVFDLDTTHYRYDTLIEALRSYDIEDIGKLLVFYRTFTGEMRYVMSVRSAHIGRAMANVITTDNMHTLPTRLSPDPTEHRQEKYMLIQAPHGYDQVWELYAKYENQPGTQFLFKTELDTARFLTRMYRPETLTGYIVHHYFDNIFSLNTVTQYMHIDQFRTRANDLLAGRAQPFDHGNVEFVHPFSQLLQNVFQ